ncbi:MAG: SMC-Scp complex subunit ScpB [Elusimicrobiota bacterium]
MEKKDIGKILETLFFITDQPVSVEQLKDIFDGQVSEETLKEVISCIKQEYADRDSPIELREVADGFQFSTKPAFSQWVRKLFKDRTTLRLSVSAIETLSIVAYKQPVTRAEIEEIRGVEVTAVLETLLERKLIKISGRKETVGRPLLYVTTGEFMRYFGLRGLGDLPSLEEFAASDTATPQQETPREPEESGYKEEPGETEGNT